MRDATEEVLVALRGPRNSIPLVSTFRSTWLYASLRGLKERGHFDAYLQQLPPQYHELVSTTIAGAWLPVSIAMAHYEACERLGLSKAEQVEMGRSVSIHAKGVILGTLLRLARNAGLTPWAPLASSQRMWDRIWVGGDLAIYKLGPCSTRIEVVSVPMARFSYYKNALCGVFEDLALLFAKSAESSVVSRHSTSTAFAIRVDWQP